MLIIYSHTKEIRNVFTSWIAFYWICLYLVVPHGVGCGRSSLVSQILVRANFTNKVCYWILQVDIWILYLALSSLSMINCWTLYFVVSWEHLSTDNNLSKPNVTRPPYLSPEPDFYFSCMNLYKLENTTFIFVFSHLKVLKRCGSFWRHVRYFFGLVFTNQIFERINDFVFTTLQRRQTFRSQIVLQTKK